MMSLMKSSNGTVSQQSNCKWCRMPHKLLPGLIIGLAILMVMVPSSVALAASRDFSLRYDVLGQGVNLAQIGNGLTTCQSGTNNLFNGLSCANTQSGNEGSNTWYNDQYRIVFIDVDGDGTTYDSSTANLTAPAGVTVLHAQLYWGGSFNPSSLWNQSLAQVMKFKGPTGGYNDITATQMDWIDISSSGRTGRSYGATADVTNLFTANPAWVGGTTTFMGANVKSTLGCTGGYSCSDTESAGGGTLGNYAGWSLLVVYQDPGDTTHTRYVGIDDGFRCVVSGSTGCGTSDLTVNMTGFNIPAGSTGNRWGILAWDGDHGTGDNFYLNAVQQSDASHPVNDYFRSRISVNGANVTSRNIVYTNNLGTDLVESNTGNFSSATTTVPARFTTGGELVLLHYFWLVTESVQIDYDYGDDPSSYGSASHQLSGNTSATTLRIGTDVTDSELGMQHSVAADGDNLLGTNDEQGVNLPALFSSSTTYTAKVTVTNNSGATAHLYGWIDLNQNGVFDTTEFASVATIPTGTTNQVYTLTYGPFTPLGAGTFVYSRFRLTTTTLTSANATGAVSNGEVEDYRMTVYVPTASVLNAFKVSSNVNGARLKWQTGSETQVLGFNVWRSGKRDGEYKLLNAAILPAKNPGQVQGADYSYLDKTVKKGKVYFYKLEVVLASGPSDWSEVDRVKVEQ